MGAMSLVNVTDEPRDAAPHSANVPQAKVTWAWTGPWNAKVAINVIATGPIRFCNTIIILSDLLRYLP